MRDQYGVVAGRVQFAIGLKTDRNVLEGRAAQALQLREFKSAFETENFFGHTALFPGAALCWSAGASYIKWGY